MTINLEDLTLRQIKQLAALTSGAITQPIDCDVGKYVIVRTYGAGVHVGVLTARVGKELRLSGARRVWSWKGANTLNEMALRGLDGSASRVSEPVSVITLTDAMEIIPCTGAAETNLRGAKWSK